jgi:hypothetical protein
LNNHNLEIANLPHLEIQISVTTATSLLTSHHR